MIQAIILGFILLILSNAIAYEIKVDIAPKLGMVGNVVLVMGLAGLFFIIIGIYVAFVKVRKYGKWH